MAERRVIRRGIDYFLEYGVYLAEKTGIKPTHVELDELLENPARFRDKNVETAGFYLPEGDKTLVSYSEPTGIGGAWGGAVYIGLYGVNEPGRLFSSPFEPYPNIRVFTYKDYGTQKAAAEEDVLKREEIKHHALRGVVKMGFPGEYYLYTRTVPLRTE